MPAGKLSLRRTERLIKLGAILRVEVVAFVHDDRQLDLGIVRQIDGLLHPQPPASAARQPSSTPGAANHTSPMAVSTSSVTVVPSTTAFAAPNE